jgi:hypothetical protein
MIVELLLKEDFFYDEGGLTSADMDTLVSRITDEECGVTPGEVSLELSKFIPVRTYKGRYYHLYRSLHQLMSETYADLDSVPRDELIESDIIYSQADLFRAIGLPMTKENVMNNVI